MAQNKIYYADDLCLDPFKTQELNSIMSNVKNDRSQAKLRSPIYQQTSPILQNLNDPCQAFKSTIKTFEAVSSNPLNIDSFPQRNEIQWRSTLKKTEPINHQITLQTFKNLGVLPDKRVLKTAVPPYANRNPIINATEPIIERRLLQGNGGGIQIVSDNTQILGERKGFLPADRRMAPPMFKAYGYLPKQKYYAREF